MQFSELADQLILFRDWSRHLDLFVSWTRTFLAYVVSAFTFDPRHWVTSELVIIYF